MDEPTLTRLADLVVGFGANVKPGQVVAIGCEPGKEYMVRALAQSAYRHGAKFVDVGWFDPYIKRARIEYGDPETLDFVPSWYGRRILALGEQRCARIGLAGPAAPGVLTDLDPALVGRDRLPALAESGEIVAARTTNWSACPCPTPAWARLVFPDLPDDEQLERLEREIIHVLRLDADDPIAVWNERLDTLVAHAEHLTALCLDALHFKGPGTDLQIGLVPRAIWTAARMETVDGIVHVPNLPTEEVFTTPDPERTEGVVRSTKPLVLGDGTLVRDLSVRFAGGRVSELTASQGAQMLRTIVASDEGSARLGEVSLVDRESRIGKLGTTFYDTLLDENAASHIALGLGFPFLLGEDAQRSNVSKIHLDFIIGSDDLTVTGLLAGGERVPILAGGRWRSP